LDGLHPHDRGVCIDIIVAGPLGISLCNEPGLKFEGITLVVALFGEDEFIRYWDCVVGLVDESPSSHALELIKL